MTVFQKMISAVRAGNPELITQQQAVQLSNEFDSQMTQIKADGVAQGQALGFKSGYEEGKQAAADQAKIKLDQMIQKLDAESTDKLTKVLEMIDEDHSKKLDAIYNQLMTEKDVAVQTALDNQDIEYTDKFKIAMQAVNNKHAKMLKEAVDSVDNKHAIQLESVYKALDNKHAKLIKQAVKVVDNNNAKKLEKISKLYKENREKAVKLVTEDTTKKYKTQLKRKQIVFENKLKAKDKALATEKSRKLGVLAESVEKYINYALEEFIPRKELISEAKYNAALKTIEKVTDVLKVNAIVQESKDGIFADYESKIASEKEAQTQLINENIQLKAKLNKKEAQIVLEEKCKECTPTEAKFLKAYFKNTSKPSIIEESIEEAKSAYKKLQSERRQSLVEESSKKVAAKPTAVVVEAKKELKKESVRKQHIVSEEKAESSKSPDLMDIYAEMLNKK